VVAGCYPRIFSPPRQSFFLFGARGTGKTTLLRATWPEATYIDLLDEARYQGYLAKEEIQAEALVRNLPGFARFLPVAALAHGLVTNVASIARDAGVARTTVEGFFSILEDTLLGFRLPAFAARLRVREQRKPKFYWIDPGLARSLKGSTAALAPEERGHLFEGWIAQLLRAYDDYRGLYDAIGYPRILGWTG